ncbi:MAG: hypothetical protein HY664_06795, partial [Chloroflexi bacterium]|nr:hypothetical protein [Chloroflexota bacterium]
MVVRTRFAKFRQTKEPAIRQLLTQERIRALEKTLALLGAQLVNLEYRPTDDPSLERALTLYETTAGSTPDKAQLQERRRRVETLLQGARRITSQ